eukprot:COSAG04_NODE_23623_length_335_cov_0.851695_1_plen_71_part_01
MVCIREVFIAAETPEGCLGWAAPWGLRARRMASRKRQNDGGGCAAASTTTKRRKTEGGQQQPSSAYHGVYW